MAFGFSIGDIVTVTGLAWNLYKSCCEAPESYGHISTDVLSLHAVLKSAEEDFATQQLPLSKQKDLKTILDGCKVTITDIQRMVDKYVSLGTQSRRMWDRWNFSAEDAAQLRLILTARVTMLSAFMSTYSQARLLKQLRRIMKMIQEGRYDGSIMSQSTINSLSNDDREVWRQVRKELEDAGITTNAIDANRSFIIQWITDGFSRGAFDICETDESGQVPTIGNINGRMSRGGLPRKRVSRIARAFARLTNPQKTLIEAISSNDLSMVERLLVSPTTLSAISQDGLQAAMLCAIVLAKEYAVILLLETGAFLDVRISSAAFKLWPFNCFGSNMSEVLWAARRPHGTAKHNYQKIMGLNAIHVAARFGNTAIIGHLLDAYPAGACQRELQKGKTPLLLSAEYGHHESVCILLERGAKVDSTCKIGLSALHWAASWLNEAMVLKLLEAGGKANALDESGKSSLHCLGSSLENIDYDDSNERVIDALLSHGAKLDQPDSSGREPLWHATAHNHIPLVAALIARGADPRHCGPRQCHVLMQFEADHNFPTSSLRYMVNSGLAEIDAPIDATGKTLLHKWADSCASYQGHRLASDLLKLGASPNAQDLNGDTPLHRAAHTALATHTYDSAFKGAVRCYELLAEQNANTEIKNKRGVTPAMLLKEATQAERRHDEDMRSRLSRSYEHTPHVWIQ